MQRLEQLCRGPGDACLRVMISRGCKGWRTRINIPARLYHLKLLPFPKIESQVRKEQFHTGVFVTFHFQTLWLHIQGLLAKTDTHMLLAGEHNGSPKFINNNPGRSLDFSPVILRALGSEHYYPQTSISSTGRNGVALLLCKNGKLRQKCMRPCQDS